MGPINILFSGGGKQTARHHNGRLRRLSVIPNKVRNELIALCGEFCGTFCFLFIAFMAASISKHLPSPLEGQEMSNLLLVSAAFGLSLAVNVWGFYRISGGLFNPAVTLGLFLAGAITAIRGLCVFVAQLAAGIAAAALVHGLVPGPLQVSTTLTPGLSVVRGLFIEAFLTAQLVVVVLMLAVEKHKSTYLAPIGIGLSLFISELAGIFWTGGSLNPARSFGPEVIAGFQSYSWIYWVGPLIGSLMATGFYFAMKFLEYQTANPGQDFDEHEAALFDPPRQAATAEDVQRPVVSSSGLGRSEPSTPHGKPALTGIDGIREAPLEVV